MNSCHARLLAIACCTLILLPSPASTQVQKTPTVHIWGAFPPNLPEYSKQANIPQPAQVLDTPTMGAYTKASKGEISLVQAPLSVLLDYGKASHLPIEILSVTDILFMHVVGDSIGPASIGPGYESAEVATLQGTSAWDSNVLFHAMSKKASCINPIFDCTVFPDNAPNLIQALRVFLSEGDKLKKPRFVELTEVERLAEKNRNPVVDALTALRFSRLLGIPVTVVEKMGDPYRAALIPAGTYSNKYSVNTAKDFTTLAGQKGWRTKNSGEFVAYVDQLNVAILNPEHQRFDLKEQGPQLFTQLTTIAERSKGIISLDPRLVDFLKTLR